MLSKHRGPLPVLGVALAFFCVSEGVAAAQTTPREVALKYAVDNAESLGVKPTDMTNLAVTSEYRSAHNQVTHVNIGQRRNGLEVFTGHVTINVNRDGRVVFAGGQPRARDQRPRGRRGAGRGRGGRGRGGRARSSTRRRA